MNARKWWLSCADDGGSPAPLVMYGGSGWDITNRLGTAANLGIRGAIAGFWTAILCRVDAQAATAAEFASQSFDTSGKGFSIEGVTGFTTARARAGNLAGNGFVSSPIATIAAGDVGKISLWTLIHTGTGGLVRFWSAGAEIGAGTPTTGYSLPGALIRYQIGQLAASFPAENLTIFGTIGGNVIPTNPQLLDFYAACKAQGDIVDTGAMGVNHRYSVKDDVVGPGFPNGLLDTVGADNTTFFTGASTGINLQTVVDPVFTW